MHFFRAAAAYLDACNNVYILHECGCMNNKGPNLTQPQGPMNQLIYLSAVLATDLNLFPASHTIRNIFVPCNQLSELHLSFNNQLLTSSRISVCPSCPLSNPSVPDKIVAFLKHDPSTQWDHAFQLSPIHIGFSKPQLHADLILKKHPRNFLVTWR